MKTLFSIITIYFALILSCSAQDDLLDILDAEVEEEIEYTAYTFKSTRIINGHSIERMQKNQLDFRINHRFGEVNTGSYELWGLDNAIVNFSLEYGLTDWLMVGLRRGTYQKAYDGSMKLTLFRQSKGKRVMPVSISYLADMSINTLNVNLKDTTREDKFIHRLSFSHQLLIARKINDRFSLQLTPSYVHRNQVEYDEENDVFALGIGGRMKVTRRLSLTAEYFAASHTADNDKFFNPLSIGVDLETGGHVFQLFFTNSRPMVEKGYIAETTGDFLDGGIYFGFNISRVFAFSGKHKE